jgi:hypothetical protein
MSAEDARAALDQAQASVRAALDHLRLTGDEAPMEEVLRAFARAARGAAVDPVTLVGMFRELYASVFPSAPTDYVGRLRSERWVTRLISYCGSGS